LDLRNKEIIILKQTCTQCGKLVIGDAEKGENTESPDAYCCCQKHTESEESTNELDRATSQNQERSGSEVNIQDTDLEATKLLGDQSEAKTMSTGSALEVDQLVANRYRVIEEIGRGGMGTVYKVQDLFLKRKAALKLLHPEFACKPVIVQRFQKEVEAIAKLSHEGIVKVHDLGVTEDGCQYMVMDLVEGKSLDALLKENHHLPVKEALDIITQVVESVGHAHAKGVVHRDLKPSNIIIATDAQGQSNVRLVDFGIAKLLEPEGDNAKLTQTGDVFGSPQYMSPEQCRGESLDQRADIYAIGCILFEIITGQTAFSDENAVKTILKHLNDARPSVSKELKVPDSAIAVIDRCLEKQKEDRYKDCLQLLTDLKKIEAGKLVKRHFASDKKRAIAKRVFFVLTIILLLTPFFFSAMINQVQDGKHAQQSTTQIPISNSWQSLDNEGQKALNKGNIAQAEKYIGEAAQAPSASAIERSRSLRKLALISHLKNESKKEREFDDKANRMEEASESSNTSARLALKQAILLLPAKLESSQSKNLSMLVKQINALVDADLKAGHPHRDLPILNLSIDKLRNNEKTQVQSLSALLASRCRTFLFEGCYKEALEDAQLLNQKLLSNLPAAQLENLLLLSVCKASNGQNHEAIKNAQKVLEQASTVDIPNSLKESLKARTSFVLGSLLLNTSKSDRAKSLIENSINNTQTAEAVAPLLEWQLNDAMHDPEIFESLLKKVLRDSTTTADPVVRSDYLSALGDVFYRQSEASTKHKEALANYTESLRLRQSALPCDCRKVRTSISKLVANLNFLGQTGKRDSDEPESVPLINQWIASIQRNKFGQIDEQNAELIKAYKFLSKASAANGDLNQTKAAMQKMLELVLKTPVEDNPFDGFFYSNARQMLTKSQWQLIEPALKARVKAAEFKASPVDAWKAKDDLGLYYYATGRMSEAGEQIRSAVESIENSNRKSLSPADRWQAADTLYNYAMYLRRLGNTDWQRYQNEAAKLRY
jgi:serine/threonine protein kinase